MFAGIGSQEPCNAFFFVCIEIVVIQDGAPGTFLGNGMLQFQQGEFFSGYQQGGADSVRADSRNQVGVVPHFKLGHPDAAVGGDRGPPLLQQRDSERISVQAVYENGVQLISVVVPHGKHHHIIRPRTQYIGETAWLGHLFYLLKTVFRGVDFHLVRGVPVSGDEHPSSVQFQGRCVSALAVQDGKVGEAVRGGVVELGAPALADSEVSGIAAAHQDFPTAQDQAESVVVYIIRFGQVPLASLEVFRCLGGDESRGVPADGDDLFVHIAERVGHAGDVHIRQPLEGHFQERDTVQLNRGRKGPLLRPAGEDGQGGQTE